jgi:tetratricopeptide (TPR) repeat protein
MTEAKRVIVTGAIGSSLCQELIQRGYAVVVFSRDPVAARTKVPGAVDYVAWQPEESGPWAASIEGESMMETKPSKEDLMTEGTRLHSLKRYDEALSVFERVLHLNGEDVDGWNGKGLVLEALRRYKEAVLAYDHLVRLAPGDPYGWERKAGALSGLSRNDEALACYEHAISLSPVPPPPHAFIWTLWHNKGNILEKLQRYEEALGAYEQALHLAPELAPTWYRKGRVLHQIGKVSDAQMCYEQARRFGFPPNSNFER